MSAAQDFVSRLQSLNIKLWVDEGNLRYRAPKGAITPALAAELQARKAEVLALLDSSADTAIQRIPDQEHYELSHAQRRLWFASQTREGSIAYNIPLHQLFQGPVDQASMAAALTCLAQRHESLRTTFVTIDGEPRQRIHSRIDFRVECLDISDCAGAEAEVRALGLAESRKPFDLETGPLFRSSLVKLPGERHVMLFTIHHIIADGLSLNVLRREFSQLYEAFQKGEPDPLLPLGIQYRDYAAWQNRFLTSSSVKVHRDYWLKKLSSGNAVLNLPTDFARPAVKTFQGRELYFSVGAEQLHTLLDFCRKQRVSLFITLLAAVKVLLHRYTGQDVITAGSPISGRTDADLEDQVGFYLNMLALRDETERDTPFESYLQRVKQTATDAYDHQIFPFDRIVEDLKVERGQSRHPLFDVIVVLQNQDERSINLESGEAQAFFEHPGTSKVDLTFSFKELPDRLLLAIEYDTDLFADERIRRMGQHFLQLVTSILASPKEPIGRLNMLTDAEWKEIAGESRQDFPEATLVELFEAQVEKTPDNLAVTFGDLNLTYRELNKRSNQLAHFLNSHGAAKNSFVGICVERSLDLLVGIIGILKAGCAYVPFEPGCPHERLKFMLEDAGIALLLTGEEMATAVDGRNLVRLDRNWGNIAHESDQNPESDVGPGHPAYLIYTSGSTGQPKGVVVTHNNVTRLFAAVQDSFHFQPADVWTLFHSSAFDFSVWEIWGALLHGGRLVVVSHWISRSPEAFLSLLASERVTVLNQTPSAFRQLIEADDAMGTSPDLSLRLVIFGGEALDLHCLKSWWDRRGDQVPLLVNMYGITETTVHVTYRPLSAADLMRPASVIGSAIQDLRIYILDQSLQPVPAGVTGEIYVSGAGLAQGYLHRPELTAGRFIPDPFGSRPGERLYKSGDLARRRSDGDLEYQGRRDHQVKIRGFRIELGEIEAAISGHPGVREAVVLGTGRDAADARLVAFVVVDGEHPFSVADLRRSLKEKLPEYMVPSTFVTVDALPLNVNGKLDRAALLASDFAPGGPEEAFVAPRNEIEQIIAGIWQEILDTKSVGVHQNFFEIGGHSLTAAKAISRIQRTLGIHLELMDVFRAPTVAGLAEVAARREKTTWAAIPPLA